MKIRTKLKHFYLPPSPKGPNGQGAGGHGIVVKRHGGSIRVKSNEGVGPEFIVTLPVEQIKPGNRRSLGKYCDGFQPVATRK